MQEIDWVRKLAREPLDDITLGALCDWLEEQGDNRVNLIKPCRIAPVVNRTGGFRRNFFQVICPKELGQSSNHRGERNARNVLSRRVYKFLLKTDRI